MAHDLLVMVVITKRNSTDFGPAANLNAVDADDMYIVHFNYPLSYVSKCRTADFHMERKASPCITFSANRCGH